MNRYLMLVWMIEKQYGGAGAFDCRLSEFAKEYKISKATLSRMINEAIDAKMIERVSFGKYRISIAFFDAMIEIRGYKNE